MSKLNEIVDLSRSLFSPLDRFFDKEEKFKFHLTVADISRKIGDMFYQVFDFFYTIMDAHTILADEYKVKKPEVVTYLN